MTRKRGNSEGTVYRDSQRGGWRGALTLPGGTRRYVRGSTRKECSDRLVEIQAKLAEGTPVGDTDTLGPFLDWWIGRLEAKAGSGRKSVNTVDNARWAVKSWIKPHLGAKRLRELSPEGVERMLDAMAAAGRSHRTIVRVKSYLGQALDVALSREKVAWNVARVAEMPETVPTAERRSLTPDEAHKVLATAEGHRLEALFVCGLMLGLRPGELTGLRWSDVDLSEATLTVSGSLKRERSELRLGETKTRRSRTLDLPSPVLAALKIHRTRQKEERLQVGSAWHDSGLIFTSEIGTPIDPSNLRKTTRALCESAGVDPVSPNEIGRHSAASLLYDAGMTLEAIADLLGHRSTRMLETHYRHRVRDSFGGHVTHVERLFGPSSQV